jgi:hypothetical protein
LTPTSNSAQKNLGSSSILTENAVPDGARYIFRLLGFLAAPLRMWFGAQPINHRARENKLADIAFLLNIEDTHFVN